MFCCWSAGGGVGYGGSGKQALTSSLEGGFDSAIFFPLPLTLGGV